jgi:hypothetical protein
VPTRETMEMRRLVGKFALFFAFIYFLVLVGGVITLAQHVHTSWLTWPLIIAPAAAFGPAVADAIRLHRTSDPERTKALWRRCGRLTLIGVALLIAAAIVLNGLTS